MASSGSSAQHCEEQDSSHNSTMSVAKEMEELRYVQIANEGMRLLLSSRLKEADELFRKTRYSCTASTLCAARGSVGRWGGEWGVLEWPSVFTLVVNGLSCLLVCQCLCGHALQTLLTFLLCFILEHKDHS